MSGQQIGAVVGGIIGAFFGAPQLGAAIGGLIGGWIAPTQINGPHIGDGASQTSAEGQPIPWIMGTFGWIQGQIVDKSLRREVKKTDDGKGSGQEVNTFEAHQDYCILICESSEIRDSLMIGPLIVKMDGKIVYDMRPDKDFAADNAKFLKNHTFYNGNEAQMPDPTCEAFPHNGVGNTPYYRGSYTMVARDINLTQYGDRIPVYEFVMVGAGEEVTTVTTSLVAPELGSFVDSAYPLSDDESAYSFTGYLGTNEVGGGLLTHSADTIAEVIAYFSNYDYSAIGGGSRTPSNYLGYSATTDSAAVPSIGLLINTYGVSNAVAQPTVVDNEALVLVYNDFVPDGTHDTLGFSGFCSIGPATEQDRRGAVAKVDGLTPNGQLVIMETCVGDDLMGFWPLCIYVTRKQVIPEVPMGDPCLLGVPTQLPDVPGFVQDCDGSVYPEPTYASITGVFKLLQLAATASIDGRLQYTHYPVGPVIVSGSADDTEAFWEAAYADAVTAGTMEAGLDYPSDYPATTSSAYQATFSITEIDSDSIGLDTALTRIAVRGGLTVDDIDVVEMADIDLLGFGILQPYNGADSMRPLMTAFTSYGSEYDGQIHFHKHGEAIETVINPDDFIVGSDQTDKNTREQEIEYPRLFSVTAIDPTQDYTARPQTERRISPDVNAIGEEQIQVPVVMTPDSHRQLAAIGMKVAWARAQGSREFSVPYATDSATYLELVAGKPMALDSKRLIAANVRLEDGEIHFEAKYDRQSAYTSDVTATPALPPTPPPSNIGGITLFAAVNIPPGRDQDDKLGLYFAFAGLLPGWPGAVLQVSADDQASWQTLIASATQSSVIGVLDATLPLAPASGDDVTNTLSVSVHGGELNSITRTQYLNEGNPIAVIKPGNTGQAEVMQFQTADETAPDDYDLMILARGRLATAPAEHAAGARFVDLSSVYFAELPVAYIGRTLYFRPVTMGTAPEANAVYSLLFLPAESQTEFAPEFLQGTRNGSDDFTATVVPRHGLGTDVTPVASSNFTGFSWRFEVSGTVITAATDINNPSYTLSAADQTLFWGSPQSAIDVSVSQTNRITGSGPTTSATL